MTARGAGVRGWVGGGARSSGRLIKWQYCTSAKQMGALPAMLACQALLQMMPPLFQHPPLPGPAPAKYLSLGLPLDREIQSSRLTCSRGGGGGGTQKKIRCSPGRGWQGRPHCQTWAADVPGGRWRPCPTQVGQATRWAGALVPTRPPGLCAPRGGRRRGWATGRTPRRCKAGHGAAAGVEGAVPAVAGGRSLPKRCGEAPPAACPHLMKRMRAGLRKPS